MSRNKIFKSVGFIGSLVGAAALVGSAVTGTGAYFSDSKDGGLTASSGHLRLNTTDRNLSFTGLMPGEDKTQSIEYNADATSGKSDIWLVFDPTSPGYKAFTGPRIRSATPGAPDIEPGGLGRYGHFAVSQGGTSLFESWNLQAAGSDPSFCVVDSDGHGHGRPATSHADTPPLCGVPASIKIESNLASGVPNHTVTLTFGLTGRATGGANDAPWASVPFKIVATQAGVSPTAENF